MLFDSFQVLSGSRKVLFWMTSVNLKLKVKNQDWLYQKVTTEHASCVTRKCALWSLSLSYQTIKQVIFCSQCHTKRRIGGDPPANPSLGMTKILRYIFSWHSSLKICLTWMSHHALRLYIGLYCVWVVSCKHRDTVLYSGVTFFVFFFFFFLLLIIVSNVDKGNVMS